MATGVQARHSSKCGKHSGKRCTCKPRYRAHVWDKAAGKPIWSAPFDSQSEAIKWRTHALQQQAAGRRASTTATVQAEADRFLDGIKSGEIRDRKGKRYKPSTVRSYERGLAKITAELGPHKLAEIRRADLLRFADRLSAKGYSGSTIKNTFNPLQAIYRRAVEREEVAANPTANLRLPAADGKRERFAPVAEAQALIEALPPTEQALWATALFGGLRRGELRALRWRHVDLDAGLIRLERGWDDHEGEIALKTDGSRRNVPIASILAGLLARQKEMTSRDADDFVFGATADRPFTPTTVRNRALKAWEAAELEPLALHECRHTCASLMIAAGCNAKALSVVMGHSGVEITFNRYGKLMPGGEAEVGHLLDAHLERFWKGQQPSTAVSSGLERQVGNEEFPAKAA